METHTRERPRDDKTEAGKHRLSRERKKSKRKPEARVSRAFSRHAPAFKLHVVFQGRYYLWEAADGQPGDGNNPCTLVCRATGHPDVVVGMDRPVADGTRCRRDSLDMCVAGRCRVRKLFFSKFNYPAH